MADLEKAAQAVKDEAHKVKAAAVADVAAAQGWLSQHKAVVISALLALLVVVVAVWLA